jgi:hypothetical protein
VALFPVNRWLHRGGRLLVAVIAASGILMACLLLVSNPTEDVEPRNIVLRAFARITGQSVAVRVPAKSKRCALHIASASAAARATGQDFQLPVPQSSGTPNGLMAPPTDLMTRIRQDSKLSREFFSHRATTRKPSVTREETVMFFIDVFANSTANDALLKGDRKFPEGSVVLKRKSQLPEGIGTEYYTGMRKNWNGYWSELGDWEFFVLDAAGKEVEAGRLESCADCHAKWPARDFVSRNYFDPDSPGRIRQLIDEAREK